MKTQLAVTFRSVAMALLVLSVAWAGPAAAKSAAEIDAGVDQALVEFKEKVKTAPALLDRAAGVLVFPSVIKAGIGVGGEYGEGALRIGGKTVDYYSTAGASFGFQFGAQAKTVILVFLEQDALDKFRNSAGWEVGVDGSVALVEVGAGGSLDTTKLQQPIVGFVIGQKGLMYNLTLEGTKMTKLVRD
ncbi:MAG: YSC84-related protein [Gammaproteobacteria bacterium]